MLTSNQIRCLLIEALLNDFGQVPIHYLEIIKAIDALEKEQQYVHSKRKEVPHHSGSGTVLEEGGMTKFEQLSHRIELLQRRVDESGNAYIQSIWARKKYELEQMRSNMSVEEAQEETNEF